ncbi:hypothetical protein [Pseudomonas baltica]|uniref:Lipoprotein n=1 Tax=Pseudomonas baltica TaxID=2762576 RepID=A0A7X1G3I6_9PSED|nr:hypothetical protein [Pseudomonas baltica]MBC2677546.1 hypothetical protein [Pseudomonas baltica]
MKFSTIILLSLAISGCVSAPQNRAGVVYSSTAGMTELVDPTAAELASADAGKYPQNYEEIVKNWASDSLKDPQSAVFKGISKPRKEFIYAQRKPVFGYTVCATINAKNSYGGYTGNKMYWMLIRDGVVLRHGLLGTAGGGLISINHHVNCNDGV